MLETDFDIMIILLYLYKFGKGCHGNWTKIFFWPFFIQNRHNVTAINRLKLFIYVVTLITELGQVSSVLWKNKQIKMQTKKVKKYKSNQT